MPAPNAAAHVDEHRKHVEEFLKIDKHKHEPKDRQVRTDAPDEDPNHKPTTTEEED